MYKGVIISGFPLSGKSTLVKQLSEDTGMEVFSVGDIFKQRWKEKHPNGEVSFEEYWKNVSFEENHEMEEKVKETFKEKELIGEFRFAKSCKSLPLLFVFVFADLDTRIERALKLGRDKGTREEIKEILLKREQDELEMGRQLYGEDYDYRNKDYYHLIVNLGKISVEEAVSVIKKLLGK